MDKFRLMMNLNEWELVLDVMQGKSMARTANEHGMDRSQLSRRIAALENALGLKFFERNGPVLQPTQRGLEICSRIRPIVEAMRKELGTLDSALSSDEGVIRLGAHPGFMQSQVAPMLGEFQQHFPGISFDVISNDDPQMYMRGQTDLMLYYGPVNQPTLDEYFVTRSAFVACASPEYLSRAGHQARTPGDLIHHAGILYTGRVRMHSNCLVLGSSQAPIHFRTTTKFNNILAAKEMAIAGGGILLDIPLYHCYNEIIEGKLVLVLDGWHVPNIDSYIASTREAARLRRVKIFIDWYIRRRRDIEGTQQRYVQQNFGLVL